MGEGIRLNDAAHFRRPHPEARLAGLGFVRRGPPPLGRKHVSLAEAMTEKGKLFGRRNHPAFVGM